MSYLVLARKYRPQRFRDVLGQDVLTDVLRGAIEEGRVGHAYLFSGPRGTGKTTTARILARALNCERGPSIEPCGECERCLAAEAGAEADLVEIDAASNNGVDYIRDLRDQAAYVPLKARFKVYLVDEVHMLSKGAFNALLKTLEEPPPHVKFLFATTELHKVPDTVLSRCQVLKLSPIAETTIAARLDEIFQLESIEAEPGVAAEIARRARGGMRDALSLTDQLLALAGRSPRVEDVARLSGEAAGGLLDEVLRCLAARDKAALLSALPAREGGETDLFEGLLGRVRGALLVGLCGKDAPMLEVGAAARDALVELSQEVDAEVLELWLQEILAARERAQRLPGHARILLETTLLELCRPETALPLGELMSRLERLEARLGGAPEAAPAAPAPRAARPREQASAPAPAPADGPGREPSPAPPRESRDTEAPPSKPARPRVSSAVVSGRSLRANVGEAWKRFLEALKEKSPSLSELFEKRGRLVEIANGSVHVQLKGMREEEQVTVQDRRNKRTVAQTFTQLLGEEVVLKIDDASGARPGKDDPFTAEVADLFGGRIED